MAVITSALDVHGGVEVHRSECLDIQPAGAVAEPGYPEVAASR